MYAGRLSPNTVMTGKIMLNGQTKSTLAYGLAVRSCWSDIWHPHSSTDSNLWSSHGWHQIYKPNFFLLSFIAVFCKLAKIYILGSPNFFVVRAGLCDTGKCSHRHTHSQRVHSIFSKVASSWQTLTKRAERDCGQYHSGNGTVWMPKYSSWDFLCERDQWGWETTLEYCSTYSYSSSLTLLGWTHKWSGQVSE
jgi:hypothetical protein